MVCGRGCGGAQEGLRGVVDAKRHHGQLLPPSVVLLPTDAKYINMRSVVWNILLYSQVGALQGQASHNSLQGALGQVIKNSIRVSFSGNYRFCFKADQIFVRL